MGSKKFLVSLAFSSAVLFLTSGFGLCAQIVGIVKNADGRPVSGIKINAIDASSGKIAGDALTGKDGTYSIDGLASGKYIFKLDPMATGFKAGDGMAYLSEKGLTVDWNVSPDAIALDDAIAGTTGGAAGSAGGAGAGTAGGIAGIGAGTLAIAGATTAAVTGGVLGGLAATGGLGGGSSSPSK